MNLFVEGTAELDVGGKKVQIEQKTKYPWDGRVEITVTPEAAGDKFALHVRIPGWARGEAWPTRFVFVLGRVQRADRRSP